MSDITGYDSVASTVAEWQRVVPVGAPAVIGSYRNGFYANSTSAKRAFPNAVHIDYDVHATDPAACLLDIEPGNVGPSAAPPWVKAWPKAGPHVLPVPGLYCSASTVGEVEAQLRLAQAVSHALDAGFSREQFLIQSAHYGHGPHICGPGQCQYPQADATQHADKGPQGQNVDTSLFSAHFFGKAPVPVHDPRYNWFDAHPRVIAGGRSERAIVQEYDKWRRRQTLTRHPHRARLAVLRAQMWLLRNRLAPMAEKGKFHRAWREHQLRIRAQGKRVV